jgi:hypothetical protein
MSIMDDPNSLSRMLSEQAQNTAKAGSIGIIG